MRLLFAHGHSGPWTARGLCRRHGCHANQPEPAHGPRGPGRASRPACPGGHPDRRLWGADPPPTAERTLRSYVSRLRAVMGGCIVASRGGFCLCTDDVRLDSIEFERLVASAKLLHPWPRPMPYGPPSALWHGRLRGAGRPRRRMRPGPRRGTTQDRCTRTARGRVAEIAATSPPPLRRPRRCSPTSARRIRLGDADSRVERRRPNRRSARRLSPGLRRAVRRRARTVGTACGRPRATPSTHPPPRRSRRRPRRPMTTCWAVTTTSRPGRRSSTASRWSRSSGPAASARPPWPARSSRRRAPAHSGGVRVVELAAITDAAAVAGRRGDRTRTDQ